MSYGSDLKAHKEQRLIFHEPYKWSEVEGMEQSKNLAMASYADTSTADNIIEQCTRQIRFYDLQ